MIVNGHLLPILEVLDATQQPAPQSCPSTLASCHDRCVLIKWRCRTKLRDSSPRWSSATLAQQRCRDAVGPQPIRRHSLVVMCTPTPQWIHRTEQKGLNRRDGRGCVAHKPRFVVGPRSLVISPRRGVISPRCLLESLCADTLCHLLDSVMFALTWCLGCRLPRDEEVAT
jgi:hypothetical protein